MASFAVLSDNVLVGSGSTHAFKSISSTTLTIGPSANVSGKVSFLAAVGVNTLYPSCALHVAGSVHASGSVGIGTTSPAYDLHVEGNIYATHDIVAFSDRSVKGNIRPITHALSRVGMLHGYTFDRTDVPTGRRHAGLIANEVVGIMDECVYKNPNGTLALAYPNMCALLIEAINELRGEVRALETQVISMSNGTFCPKHDDTFPIREKGIGEADAFHDTDSTQEADVKIDPQIALIDDDTEDDGDDEDRVHIDIVIPQRIADPQNPMHASCHAPSYRHQYPILQRSHIAPLVLIR